MLTAQDRMLRVQVIQEKKKKVLEEIVEIECSKKTEGKVTAFDSHLASLNKKLEMLNILMNDTATKIEK